MPCSSTTQERQRLRATPAGCCAGTASSTGSNARLSRLSRTTSRRFTAEKRKKVRRERRRCEEAGIALRDAASAASSTTRCCDQVYALHARHFPRARPRALPEPGILRARSRGRMGEALMVKLAHARRRAGRCGDLLPIAPTRCTAATGARPPTSTACISRPATTRASTTASSTASQRFEPGTQGEHKVSRGFVPHAHLVGALHRRSALPRGHRRLPAARSAGRRRLRATRSRAHVPVPPAT